MPPSETEPTDEQLACQVQAGTSEVFETLVTRYQDRLFQFLKLKTADRRDAEELTQSSLVTAYQKIHLYDPKHAFATWLFTIARRLTIDHYRRHKNRPTTNALPEESAAHTLVETRTAMDHVSETENHSALWESIRGILDEKQFSAMWLRYQEDLPVAEVATALGKTKTHTKVILHRARQRLIAQLPDARCTAPAGLPISSPAQS